MNDPWLDTLLSLSVVEEGGERERVMLIITAGPRAVGVDASAVITYL